MSEPVQWGVNGHWYNAIYYPSTWIQAYTHAKKQSHNDLPGHLATLTSAGENDFVWQTFQKDKYWLGGFQVRKATEVDKGWKWITGEPWNFTNWGPPEPNDGGDYIEDGQENFLHFLHGDGQWNDNPGETVEFGYIIEYEAMSEQTLAPIRPKDVHQLTTTWANLKKVR